MKEAQTLAAAECERFAEAEEQKFRKDYAEKFASENPTKKFEDQTKLDIEEIKNQYKAHRDKAITLLLHGVVRVDLDPTPAEAQRFRLHYLQSA